jgi:hypothetical protein
VVEDATAGTLYATFQAAVKAAKSGDTLNVQGTCEGDTFISDKSLTIKGQGPGATLNGENQSQSSTEGSVLYILGVSTTISDLTITGGNAQAGGGGIYNLVGDLTLTDSTVTGNHAQDGGGIFNNDGTLTVTGSAITNNHAVEGGGLYVGGPLTLSNSTVTGNTASMEGGGIYDRDGAPTTFESESKEVSGNTPDNVFLEP